MNSITTPAGNANRSDGFDPRAADARCAAVNSRQYLKRGGLPAMRWQFSAIIPAFGRAKAP